MRAYRFRLYPNRLQEEALRHHLWLSKELWNRMLNYSKSKYKSERKFASKKELREMVKRQGLFSQVAQELVDRLVDATWRFVKLKKEGKDCGFPRFKSFDRLKSLCYPQMGFKLENNRLKVTPFGEIKLKLHRQVKGKIKTLTLTDKCASIRRHINNMFHWYFPYNFIFITNMYRNICKLLNTSIISNNILFYSFII